MPKELKQNLSSAQILNAITSQSNNSEINSLSRALVEGVNPQVNGTTRPISADEARASLNAIGQSLLNTPSLKNAWLTELWNRIGRTIYEGYAYRNKLERLEKGELPFGMSIQDIFTSIASPYDYSMNETEGTNAEAIYADYPPDVQAAYYHINYRKNYRVSTFDVELKQAFLSYDGVGQLIMKIVQRLYDAMRWDEELAGRYLISRYIVDGYVGVTTIPELTLDSGLQITTTIKNESLEMDNMDSRNNAAHVITSTPVEEQLLIVTNLYDSYYTVDVQSAAFNLDKVSYLARKMTIRSFSFTTDEITRLNSLFKNDSSYEEFTSAELAQLEQVQAVLIDRNFTQYYRNYESFYSRYDELHLKTNHFLHIWKIYAISPFANAKAFISGPQTVNSVTITPTSLSVQKGQAGQFYAQVSAYGFVSRAVIWSIVENTTASYIDATGLIHVGINETNSTLTVKATSTVDSTKSATATVTVVGD